MGIESPQLLKTPGYTTTHFCQQRIMGQMQSLVRAAAFYTATTVGSIPTWPSKFKRM